MIAMNKKTLKHSLLSTAILSAIGVTSQSFAAPQILIDNYSVDAGENATAKVSLNATDITNFGSLYAIELADPKWSGRCWKNPGYVLDDNTITPELIGSTKNEVSGSYNVATNWLVSSSDTTFPELEIADCESGVYRVIAYNGTAKITGTETGTQADTSITINPEADSNKKILLLDAVTSRAAHNSYGGGKLYDYDGDWVGTVAISRPMGKETATLQMAGWLLENNYDFDAMSLLKLNTTAIADNYKTVIIAGRSEMWTDSMVTNLQNYVQAGGNVMVLGAETMRYTATIDETAGTLSADTQNAAGERTAASVKALLGLNFAEGGYVNDTAYAASTSLSPSYTVTDATHWVYTGSTVTNNATFGADQNLVGRSVDGLDLSNKSNNFTVIASADAKQINNVDSNAIAGLYTGGNGAVFHAGTTNWVNGLFSLDSTSTNTTVQIITKNVLDVFTSTTGLTSDSDNDGVPTAIDPDDSDATVTGNENLTVDETTDDTTDDSDNSDNSEDTTTTTASSSSSGGGSTGLGLGLIGLLALARRKRD